MELPPPYFGYIYRLPLFELWLCFILIDYLPGGTTGVVLGFGGVLDTAPTFLQI